MSSDDLVLPPPPPGCDVLLQSGFLLVVSGASGSGKSSVCRTLARLRPDLYLRSISATTRPPRAGEQDGVSYHYLSRERFEQRVAAGELLEHAEVFGQLYGTPRAGLEQARASGRTLLLDIDVQGGHRLRQSGTHGLWVWISAPSREVLAERLRGRRTESPDQVARRLAAAESEERAAAGVYDEFLVNDDLDTLTASIHRHLLDCVEKLRTS